MFVHLCYRLNLQLNKNDVKLNDDLTSRPLALAATVIPSDLEDTRTSDQLESGLTFALRNPEYCAQELQVPQESFEFFLENFWNLPIEQQADFATGLIRIQLRSQSNDLYSRRSNGNEADTQDTQVTPSLGSEDSVDPQLKQDEENTTANVNLDSSDPSMSLIHIQNDSHGEGSLMNSVPSTDAISIGFFEEGSIVGNEDDSAVYPAFMLDILISYLHQDFSFIGSIVGVLCEIAMSLNVGDDARSSIEIALEDITPNLLVFYAATRHLNYFQNMRLQSYNEALINMIQFVAREGKFF